MPDDLLAGRVSFGFQTDFRAQRGENFNVVAGLFEVLLPILSQIRVRDALQSCLVDFDPAFFVL